MKVTTTSIADEMTCFTGYRRCFLEENYIAEEDREIKQIKSHMICSDGEVTKSWWLPVACHLDKH